MWKDLQIGQFVYVEWIDAQGTEAWTSFDELIVDKLPLIKTGGFILAIDAEHITVAQSVDVKNESASHTMKIPMGMVTDILQFG